MGLGLSLSCQVAPVDVPIFTELNPNKAFYVYTISNREGIVDNDKQLFQDKLLSETPLKWNEIKKYSIYVPSFSWAKIEAMILKLCKVQKQDCESAGNPDEKVERFHQFRNLSNTQIESYESESE